ncbi:MAG: tRNA (adenosine(37)-N6)-threonylcarbamoyltransferase complex transferase subunit TsaD [Thermodesulfobacteriota bacterium]
MLILGIDSSCDDMSASVIEDGRRILSNTVSSQHEIHKRYGGIVPELAARRHLETVIPVVEEALREAEVSLDDIQGIGVTQGPGLVVSLLVGLSFAKAVSLAKEIPFAGVNHLEGHILSILLEKDDIGFPYITLIVSGGHTILCEVRSIGEYIILGQTRDDAAGEAFDKVAKLLGLGYPGGVEIDKKAGTGNPGAFAFPRAYISKESLEFSFSGLKTAAYRVVRDMEPYQLAANMEDLTASFQEAIVDILIDKSLRAAFQRNIEKILVTGGVAANSRLRFKMKERVEREGLQVFFPSHKLCTDNGAMIAVAAYHRLKKGENSTLDLNALPNLQL